MTASEPIEAPRTMAETLRLYVDITRPKVMALVVFTGLPALFLGKDDQKPRNGLHRWVKGLPNYTPGYEIEKAADKRECLASQCLPRHVRDVNGLHLAQHPIDTDATPQPGQAIATAPVTCELCHVGLAGYDKLVAHCRLKHGGFAEYRKRVFYRAREAGHVPLQPWVKRSMVQGFQFFRLHSVPSSFNDWTMKATQKAEHRREEACAGWPR